MSKCMESHRPSVLDGTATRVPGQTVIPGMQGLIGHESAVLDPWVENFCWAYVLNGGNGQDAYLKAKPKVKDTTARVESSKLLTIPAVCDRIAAIQQENRRRWAVTADDVIEFHGRTLKTDRRLFFRDNGSRIPVHELPDDLAAIVDLESTYSKDAGVVLLPAIASRQKAADALSRIMGLDKSRVEVTGADGGPVQSLVADNTEKFAALRERLRAIKDAGFTA